MLSLRSKSGIDRISHYGSIIPAIFTIKTEVLCVETINIYGGNCLAKPTKIREACRGIVVKEGNILLSYEPKSDQWMIPGGGVEADEGYESCCIRELAEETGFLVKPLFCYLTINEYYKGYLYPSRYFICKVVGQTERSLTEREVEEGLEPRWIPVDEAIKIFSRHQDHSLIETKRGMYLREFRALTAYCNAGAELLDLAMKHIYGNGVPEDNELAAELLIQAYELGHVEATYSLGICYHYGYGVTVDLAKAYDLYLEAASAGYSKGMELVGRFYNQGIYVKKDRTKAEYWLKKAMESSEPDVVEEARKELENNRESK